MVLARLFRLIFAMSVVGAGDVLSRLGFGRRGRISGGCAVGGGCVQRMWRGWKGWGFLSGCELNCEVDLGQGGGGGGWKGEARAVGRGLNDGIEGKREGVSFGFRDLALRLDEGNCTK